MKIEKISMQEILEALNDFSTKVQQQFVDLENRMNERFDNVDQRFIALEQRLDYHQVWLERIEKNMATKAQFNSLVGILRRKDLISEHEAVNVTI